MLLGASGSGLGGSGDAGGALGSFYSHTIDQSLKIDDASGGYLTISSASPTATNRKKVTISCWVKRAGISVSGVCTLFWADSAGLMFQFFADNSVYIYDNNISMQGYVQPDGANNRLFRDPTAWYHLALIIDTTQSTAADRAKFYVNGTLQALSSYPGQNVDVTWHTGSTMRIGSVADAQDLAGYIAEFISIDGQNVAISDLAETKDGVWVPKDVSGLTLGNAGFYLKFDNSSDIGNDSGSNNIDFTATNLAATDVVLDSPTNNFSTMNPIYHSSSQATLSEGNLKVDGAGFVNAAHGYGAVSTFSIPKDKKIYIEVECTDGTGDNWFAGFATQSGLESGPSSTNVGGSSAVTFYNRAVFKNGTQFQYHSNDGVGGLGGGTSPLAAGDILGMAVDGSNGNVWLSKNGSYFKTISANNTSGAVGNTGNPSAGSDPVATIDNVPSEDLFVVVGSNTSVSSIFVNFGQDSTNVASANTDANGIGTFEYAPPTDYLALCSSNMSDITIGPGQDEQADSYFNTVLWTGDGNTSRAITGVGFAPDWMWLKSRSHTEDHALEDTVRGVGRKLDSASTAIEETTATAVLSAHGSDGFTLPASTPGNLNVNTRTYVAWNWKAGGAPTADNSAGVGATPTAGSVKIDGANLGSALAGSIAATRLSANTEAGFSIIKWTGNQTNSTLAHGLSATPEIVIVKSLAYSSGSFYIWHKDITNNKVVFLNATNAETGSAGAFVEGDMSSTVIGLGTERVTNGSSENMLAYVFHSVEGFSKIGSYIGNADADGPFIYTGFRPAFIIMKCILGGTGNWFILDTTRSTFNEADDRLNADANSAESTGNADIDFLSNGFKIRTASSSGINQNTDTHIYIAFAEAPFKFANAR